MWFRSYRPSGSRHPDAVDVAAAGGIDRTIARLNIEHFRKLLSEDLDEAKREVIRRLLFEEEAKLAALDRCLIPDDNKD